MDIGYILWFGGYSKKAKEELDYGFIQSLTFDDRVFIHASEIADDSQFLDKMREGVLVAFNIRTGRKGLYAYDLHLLYVFCPQGQSRTYSRRECNYRSGKGLTHTPYQETGRFEHQHLTDFLRNLNFIPDLYCLGIQDATLWEYSYKISSQVNRLISLRPHMKCRCGNWLISNFKYSKKIDALLSSTVFNCTSSDAHFLNPDFHDYNVYLNHCYHCKKTVDSRECKIREDRIRGQDKSKGAYLCMNCGGSPHFSPGTICPNCGTEIYSSHIQKRNKPLTIRCTKCYHCIILPRTLKR